MNDVLVEVEFVGGPLDGEKLKMPELQPRRAVVFAAKGRDPARPDVPVFLLYRPESPTTVSFSGYTDEDVPYVLCWVVCRTCGCERDSVHPERAEMPLQCPDCKSLSMWPKPQEADGG